MSDSAREHRRAARGASAGCAVLTISDSRGPRDDPGGDLVVERLANAGHEVLDRRWTPDEPAAIEKLLHAWLARAEVGVVVTTGGTGVSRRDATPEVVEALLEQRLPGFGELFRMLSYAEIGAAAMLSRASAGVAAGTLIFALPGSVAAVELALEKLIVPELAHLLWERRR